MFYEEHERRIYTPPGSDRCYDPLAINRALTIVSENRFDGWWAEWCAASDGLGDVGPGSEAARGLMSAVAEEQLVRVGRVVFGLGTFEEGVFDATVLEYLRDFVDWLEKKGRRGETPPSPITTAPAA